MKLKHIVETVVWLAVSLILMGCGLGDDSRTEESAQQLYFEELHRIGVEAQASDDRVSPPSVGSSAAEYRSFIGATRKNLDESVSRVRELVPPAEAEAEHDRFVQSLEAMSMLWREFETELDFNMEPAQVHLFVLRFYESTELSAASTEIDLACSELQAIADGTSSPVDLECER